jgi:hypothetical protein
MKVIRLYPERGSTLYARVQVWPTKRALLDHLNERHFTLHGNRFGGRTQGACSGHEVYRFKNGRPRERSRCFAVVNLWRGQLGIGVITHEFFHATLRWAGRVGHDLSQIKALDCSMHEERIAYVHGELCRQFMVKGLRPGGIYTAADVARSA